MFISFSNNFKKYSLRTHTSRLRNFALHTVHFCSSSSLFVLIPGVIEDPRLQAKKKNVVASLSTSHLRFPSSFTFLPCLAVSSTFLGIIAFKPSKYTYTYCRHRRLCQQLRQRKRPSRRTLKRSILSRNLSSCSKLCPFVFKCEYPLNSLSLSLF